VEATQSVKKLSAGRMLTFGIGDIFGGGSFNIFNFLYPVYIVLAIGLSPFYVAIIMFVARVFDAIIDPPIGIWSDKLRIKYGTRRRSLIFSAPLVLIGLFLTFYPHNTAETSELFRFFVAMFSYLFYCLIQSSIMVPYQSLGSEITDDYIQRGRATTVRLGFSIFSSIVCVALPGMIVAAYEGNNGYMVMSLIFGSVFMICILITALFAKEGIPPQKEAPEFTFNDFVRPLKLKVFRQYMGFFLCCQLTMTVMSGLFFFYVLFYFNRDLTAAGETSMIGYIAAALMFAMQIVALPIYMAMMKKTGKMAVYIFGSVIWIISAVFLFFLPPSAPYWVLLIIASTIGFGISGPGLIPHATFGDIVDVGYLKFGVRDAGALSGISSFLNTSAQGFGLAIAMAVIGWAGFTEPQPGMEEVLTQPESAQWAIRFLMLLTPLILMSLGIFFCAKYRLNKERHALVLAAIDSGDKEEKERVLATLQ